MKKRILAAVFAGLMVVSMAAGCANPKVTLGQYKGIELTDVSQEEVDKQLEEFMAKYEAPVEVDREAKEGDTVNINFVGMLDGVAFEGGTDDSEAGTDLVLGSNSFIDGFEDGLIGATKGQELDLDLTFPDPYENNPDLAGKAVVFHVTVNKVMENQIPELDDAFVEKYFSTVASDAEEFLNVFREDVQKSAFYNQITESIMGSSTVEKIPEERIAEEALVIVNEYTSYAQMYASVYGADTETMLYYLYGLESTEALQNYALQYAELLVKNMILMEEIAKAEGLEVTEEIYDEKVAEYTAMYGYDTRDSFVKAYGGEEVLREEFMNELVMDFIIENATIVQPKESEETTEE